VTVRRIGREKEKGGKERSGRHVEDRGGVKRGKDLTIKGGAMKWEKRRLENQRSMNCEVLES